MSLVDALDWASASAGDTALLVMPMCHANSLYISAAFSYLRRRRAASTTGRASTPSSCCGRSRRSGVDVHVARADALHHDARLCRRRARRLRREPRAQAADLLGAGAADTKLAIMEYFRNSRLFELYGSTEAGWVTVLQARRAVRPSSARSGANGRGRRRCGSLDRGRRARCRRRGRRALSRTPYAFDGYWKLPEKTAEAFRGGYCSVGDLARRDEDGFIHLVDRKSNMIITGGENVYPSEVENVLGAHPGGEGRRGGRRAAREMGRGGARGHRPARRRGGWRGRRLVLVPRPDRRLQAAAVGLASSPRPRCRAPPPARSCTACCGCAMPALRPEPWPASGGERQFAPA